MRVWASWLTSWLSVLVAQVLSPDPNMEDGLGPASEGISLVKAVRQSRLRLARLLLEGGAYINESNEHGETPLMVACKTRRMDHQGVGKARMVQYLLESGADPNIQDKAGKTALMHACLAKAGPQVAALLLQSGADLSLQDHAGHSALVHAINAEDEDTLQVLLGACQARGKEVIIITTAKLPSGRHTTQQYLRVPPGDSTPATGKALSQTDVGAGCSPPSPPAEAEPASPGPRDGELPGSEDSWDPGSPVRNGPRPPQAPGWIKTSPALKYQHRVASLQEELRDISPEEELSYRTSALALSKRFITRHQSIDSKDPAHLLRAWEQATSRKESSHEASPQAGPLGDQDPDVNVTTCASPLSSIVQKRNAGLSHDSSDSQLAADLAPPALGDGRAPAGTKKVPSPAPCLLAGPKDLAEPISPGALGRRGHAVLERRGSAAFAADLGAMPPRPGFLPPLHTAPHPPGVDVHTHTRICSLLSCGQKVLTPTVPIFPKEFKSKKMLLRRQSLQTEQIKQLVNF
ncbi:ankyrin repeat domain-containing protein 34B [Ctenodactylus gundi]